MCCFNRVVRDISIRPGGQLQIAYGVTLKFLPSVGIMVGGHFHAEGSGHSDGNSVKFTLFDPGRVNASDAPVRLVGGRTRKDGRLQVSGQPYIKIIMYLFIHLIQNSPFYMLDIKFYMKLWMR